MRWRPRRARWPTPWKGADVVFGLSVKGALTEDMVRSMAPNPIIFAMANPDPEITPEEVAEVRDDAIMATGRSDYPNQVNNVLGFPYIFRGALDVRATTINEDMKIAAAQALAELAREDVPDEVACRLSGQPAALRPAIHHSGAVRSAPDLGHSRSRCPAAMDSGVAQKPILNMDLYAHELSARRDPIASTLQRIYERVRRHPRRVVFAEGEEEQVMRAAVSYVNQRLGTACLLGREEQMRETAKLAGIDLDRPGIELVNARVSRRVEAYTDYLYSRLQRKGYLQRDCQRLINTDRNHFGACMVALGDADAMVTGTTRNYSTALEDVRRCIDVKPGHRMIGCRWRCAAAAPCLVADTAVIDMPNAEELADIAEEASGMARRLGYEPRVAMLAYSTFGHPTGERSDRVREAVRILDKRRVDFEYDGEMAADVALNPKCDGAISVLPPVGHGQCAGHAGVPLGLDLDQDARGTGRLHRHRPASGRARQVGSDRLDGRQGFRHRQHGGDCGLQRVELTGLRRSNTRIRVLAVLAKLDSAALR
jgi:malate dehydrogenase (oxaloacetate-decarboxylating)(NADP+)